MTLSRRARLLAAIALLAVPAAAMGQSSSTQPRAKTVLAIHWGASDYPSAAPVNEAIRAALTPHDEPIDYFAEYLESDRVSSETASQALADYIRNKYRDRRIDLVLAIADPALRFALDYRSELFPGVPIVYSGVALPSQTDRRADGGITAVMRGMAYAETLKLALDLHPLVKNVFVIGTSRDVSAVNGLRVALDEFSRRVALNYVDQPTLPELLAAVKAVPAQSVILLVWYAPSDPPVPGMEGLARQIAEVAPVPVYGTNERYFGSGIVGGVVRGPRETGTRMGELARQILEGTRAQDIPIEDARLVPILDWRQVQRWGVDPSRLPPGSDIQFRTPTVWETYRTYIVVAGVVVGAQLLLIAGLLVQRERRRRAEHMIRTSEAALRTSYERIRQLAGRLINAEEAARANIARDLHDGVCQQLAGVAMIISSLKRSLGDIQDPLAQETLLRLQGESLDMLEGIRRLSHELHPASLQLLGLAAALKAHCSEVAKQHRVDVSFKTEGDVEDLRPEAIVCLFRIAQESLRNSVDHAEAKRIAVSLVRSGKYIELTVTDNGRGFDPQIVRREGAGLGLVSIEERAHVVGGEVQIISGVDKGTTVRVRCPAGQGIASVSMIASASSAAS